MEHTVCCLDSARGGGVDLPNRLVWHNLPTPVVVKRSSAALLFFVPMKRNGLDFSSGRSEINLSTHLVMCSYHSDDDVTSSKKAPGCTYSLVYIPLAKTI